MAKNFLGIDIGTSSVKVVELERQGARARLKNYVIADTPLQTKPDQDQGLRNNFLRLSEKTLAALLKTIFTEGKIAAGSVFIAIPIYTTFTTLIEVPQLKGEALVNAIQFEAKRHVPLPLNEVVLEWKPVGRAESKPAPTDGQESAPAATVKPHQDKQRYLLMAVPREIVQKYKQLVRLIKIELEALEIETFSLLRLVVPSDGAGSGTILLDIGGQNTSITAFAGQIIYWSGNFSFSGNDLTRALVNAGAGQKLSLEQAESLKRSRGLNDERTRAVLQPIVDSIFRKVTGVIEDVGALKIGRIVLAGGSARLPGLIEYAKQKFNLPVGYVTPWEKINLPTALNQHAEELAATLGVAAGIALRGRS